MKNFIIFADVCGENKFRKLELAASRVGFVIQRDGVEITDVEDVGIEQGAQ